MLRASAMSLMRRAQPNKVKTVLTATNAALAVVDVARAVCPAGVQHPDRGHDCTPACCSHELIDCCKTTEEFVLLCILYSITLCIVVRQRKREPDQNKTSSDSLQE